jgi:heterotetrameric sarcosine oxidase delta subunit
VNVLTCPWCGRRDEVEFTWSGEAHGARPESPQQLSDEAWTDYLHVRANPKGVIHERWCHTYGCRQWFNLVRHTVTHEVYVAYRLDEAVPEVTE